MKLSLLIGTVFLWAIAHFTCATLEGSSVGMDMSTFYTVFGVSWAEMNTLQQVFTVALLPLTFIFALFKMWLFLDYGTIFQGDWVWFRTMILWPISVGMVYAVVINLRGTSSS